MTYNLDESHNSNNYTPAGQVLSVFGYPRTVKWITIHHWGANGQQYDVVRDYLCTNTTPTSAHYVVEAGQAACIVNETDAAWHAGNAQGNAQSIGIECHPEATDADYQTIAEVIRDIRSRFGDVPLVPHNYWTATDCPGDYDLARLDRLARASITAQSSTVTPIPKGFLMALTDAQQTQLFNNINLLVARTAPIHRGNSDVPMTQEIADSKTVSINNNTAIRNLAAAVAAIAGAPSTSLALTDAQVQQIITALPTATLAAFKEQINK